MLLEAAACRLRANGRLWLAGAKRAGIASAPRRLEQRFDRVAKLDSACHCSLFEASQPRVSEPFSLDHYESAWHICHAGKTLELRSLPGVFAHGRLDRGTRLLLDTLEERPVRGRVLDFASGCGVIGASVLQTAANAEVVLLDDSALAIEAGRRTLAANGLKAVSIASNGFSELSGRYDWIVSNPPFHRGVEQDVGISADFFYEAGTFLSENGRIRVVFNRHLPYTGWARQSFNRVDCLVKTREFTVIEASNTK
jgi:16S rRNA (guanine1207-N2)-methyltransferase